MKKDTIQSIENKLLVMLNHQYFVYKYFQSAGKDKKSRRDITEYYLNNASWIKDIFDKLIANNFDPYIVMKDRIRKKKDFKNHIDENKFNNRIIIDETMIQRHLVKSKLYEDELGRIIDYECDIPLEAKRASVDLISYKEIDGKLHLILGELKKCSFLFTNKALVSDDPAIKRTTYKVDEAKDLLLRAMMEVATYGCYFYSALKHGSDFSEYLKGLLPDKYKNIDLKNDAFIDYYIIAPKNIVEECQEDYIYKNFDLSRFKFYSIEQSEDFDIIGYVGDVKKYFTIKEVK